MSHSASRTLGLISGWSLIEVELRCWDYVEQAGPFKVHDTHNTTARHRMYMSDGYRAIAGIRLLVVSCREGIELVVVHQHSYHNNLLKNNNTDKQKFNLRNTAEYLFLDSIK